MKNDIFDQFDPNVPAIEGIIGYTFRDKTLLRQAFTRTSFSNEHKSEKGDTVIQSNEVLEFFGDSVLSAVIISSLITDYSERYAFGIRTALGEGELSNIKSKLSDKKNLSRSMRELGLQRFLIMGEGDKEGGIENQPSVMEDLFESIVGAIYIDCDMQIRPVRAAVAKMLDVESYLADSGRANQSFKNDLQEYCASPKHRLPAPVYKTIAESGPDHEKQFERVCYIGDRAYGRGVGKNQKLADALAAEATLAMLKEEEAAGAVVTVDDKLTPDSFVSRLYEYAAKHRVEVPVFTEEEAPEYTKTAPVFFAVCRFMGKVTSARGASKKLAKQNAAAKMLEKCK